MVFPGEKVKSSADRKALSLVRLVFEIEIAEWQSSTERDGEASVLFVCVSLQLCLCFVCVLSVTSCDDHLWKRCSPHTLRWMEIRLSLCEYIWNIWICLTLSILMDDILCKYSFYTYWCFSPSSRMMYCEIPRFMQWCHLFKLKMSCISYTPLTKLTSWLPHEMKMTAGRLTQPHHGYHEVLLLQQGGMLNIINTTKSTIGQVSIQKSHGNILTCSVVHM